MKNLNPYGLSLCLISLICWSSLLVYFNRDKLISEEEQRVSNPMLAPIIMYDKLQDYKLKHQRSFSLVSSFLPPNIYTFLPSVHVAHPDRGIGIPNFAQSSALFFPSNNNDTLFLAMLY